MEPSSNLTKEYCVEKFKNQKSKLNSAGPSAISNLEKSKQLQQINQQKLMVLQLRD